VIDGVIFGGDGWRMMQEMENDADGDGLRRQEIEADGD
jgi:hypothetical protein